MMQNFFLFSLAQSVSTGRISYLPLDILYYFNCTKWHSLTVRIRYFSLRTVHRRRAQSQRGRGSCREGTIWRCRVAIVLGILSCSVVQFVIVSCRLWLTGVAGIRTRVYLSRVYSFVHTNLRSFLPLGVREKIGYIQEFVFLSGSNFAATRRFATWHI